MKKRKLFLILAAVLVLTVSGTVIALASDARTVENIKWFFGINTSNLTDQQKADASDYLNKMTDLQKENAKEMADLQKEAIDKMVANGSMTKEQGDAAKKKIDDQLSRIQQGEFPKGYGFGLGMGKGPTGFQGRDDIDLSKLTDAQKAELKADYDSIVSTEKEAVNKLVSDGALTKEQGDAAVKKIDDMAQKINNNNLPFGLLMEKGCFLFWDMKGIGAASLTDSQKADLKDYITKIASLQKDIINKLVADGVITKDQGDSFINRIDAMTNNFGTNSFPGGRMNKGGFGGKGSMRNPKGNQGQNL